ncbi:MAG TPA: TonB-dependent receptor [Puia sp.]|nr:TonB-dependent receptor [Puia sp.]
MASAVLWMFLLLLAPRLYAQDSTTLVTVTIIDQPFPAALAILEMKIPYKFAYSNELARMQKNVSIRATAMPLPDFLQTLFRNTGLSYRIIGDQIVVQQATTAPRITFSGYIRDARTGESLVGASVYAPGLRVGTLSNNYGFYSLTIPRTDSIGLEISYVGYQPLDLQLSGAASRQFSFPLEHSAEQEAIGKLVVTSDRREDNVRKNQPALVELSTEMVTAAPSISGSGDIIGSVEMLPGVQAGIDGTPGYFVRGGNAGQNLILLDDATLYNPSHIFGLVGIFNPPAIKYASLLKGGFPASYGDHLSSVLDVVMKDGSNQQYGGTLQAGTVSSGATLWGPVQPGKSSFLISGRRSTTDLLLKPFLDSNYFSHYYFYDLNAKLNVELTPKDRLLASFYTGRDNNTYSSDTASLEGINYAMNYGNTAVTLRWNHQYSTRLFGHTTVEYNHYHQFLSAAQEGYFAQLYSGIRDMDAKSELGWWLSPAHTISGGVDYLHQTVFPSTLSGQVAAVDSARNIVPSGIQPLSSNRLALYASDAMHLGDRWQVYVGLRTPYYMQGAARYRYIEPRASVLFMIDQTTSIKLAYSKMHQFVNLVQSYNATFPAEVWINSSATVKPQVSHEVTAGLYKNFDANRFQTSLEVYYKKMGNQLLFGGTDTQAIDNTIEKQLIFGKGWDYGMEIFVRKATGRWTGWLAYTWAYAFQQFDSLNEGQSFPFAYDRRQMLDLSLAYSLSSHWKLGTNFLIASGRAFSLSPDSSYILNPGPGQDPLYDNPGRGRGRGRGRNQGTGGSWDVVANNYRLSPYNRLDFDLEYTKRRVVGSHTLETDWIFSIYNVYARPNNALVYRTIDPNTRTVVAKQLPLIPVIPSLTYLLKF